MWTKFAWSYFQIISKELCIVYFEQQLMFVFFDPIWELNPQNCEYNTHTLFYRHCFCAQVPIKTFLFLFILLQISVVLCMHSFTQLRQVRSQKKISLSKSILTFKHAYTPVSIREQSTIFQLPQKPTAISISHFENIIQWIVFLSYYTE